ncbi:MAG TPA: hypothetical protein VHP33_08510 [Polyangiaceae bacterium]|nr:hypothetical protein [Polyangiaceae bacterium]
MNVEGQPQQLNKSMRVVGIGIGVLGIVFAVGLGALIFYMVRPRGDKVGDTNLTDPLATLVVNAKGGDSLVFRVDASVQLAALSLSSDDVVEQRVSAQLRSSLLTVHATAPSGREQTATCAVYKGRATATTTTSGKLTRSGMLNDCAIPLDQDGPWNVRGSVAWHPELKLESATLETRLEAGKH